jgi:hypothetical protein
MSLQVTEIVCEDVGRECAVVDLQSMFIMHFGSYDFFGLGYHRII